MRELRSAAIGFALLITASSAFSQPIGWDGNHSLDARHNFMQGTYHYDAGDLLPAAEYYRKAVYQDPQLEKAWYNLALVQYQLKKYRKAEACLDTLFSLNPLTPEAYGLYGMTLYHRGAYARAVKAFNFALEATPSEDLFLARALAYIGAGETQRAVSDFDQVLRARPGSMTACMGKGAALMELGDYSHAITFFNRILDLDPENTAALTNRAICFAEKGDHQKSEKDFSSALLYGGQVDSYLARAKCRLQAGQLSAATADVRSAMRLSPENPDVYYTLGEIELHGKQYQAALESFSVALDLNPLCTACFLLRSEAEALTFQYKNAIDDLYNALEIEPGSKEAKEKLLWVYGQIDKEKREWMNGR